MNVEQLFSNTSSQYKLPNLLKKEQFDIIRHILTGKKCYSCAADGI